MRITIGLFFLVVSACAQSKFGGDGEVAGKFKQNGDSVGPTDSGGPTNCDSGTRIRSFDPLPIAVKLGGNSLNEYYTVFLTDGRFYTDQTQETSCGSLSADEVSQIEAVLHGALVCLYSRPPDYRMTLGLDFGNGEGYYLNFNAIDTLPGIASYDIDAADRDRVYGSLTTLLKRFATEHCPKY